MSQSNPHSDSPANPKSDPNGKSPSQSGSNTNRQTSTDSEATDQEALFELVGNGQRICRETIAAAKQLDVQTLSVGGGIVLDFGSNRIGTLNAGIRLAELCLGGLGRVSLFPSDTPEIPWPRVMVVTDYPLYACIASQYAGWPYATDSYFAMCSGPARLNRGQKEPILAQHQLFGQFSPAIGIFESSKIPSAEVLHEFADQCQVLPESVTLCIARTASLPGTVQVVARSIETAMHKLHELAFDLRQVKRGIGWATLPPIGKNDLVSMGWTNDSILYGGQVNLWVDADDELLEKIVPLVPSKASADFGEPFGKIFDRYDRDFYQIDKLLFSPAVIMINNLKSGRCYKAGELRPDILTQSFNRENK